MELAHAAHVNTAPRSVQFQLEIGRVPCRDRSSSVSRS